MLIQSEKNLLTFIKYSPMVLIILIAFLINSLIYYQNEENLKKDLEIYKKNYIETNKIIVKNHVDKAIEQIAIEKATLEVKLKASLKARVDEAYSLVENIYKKFPNKSKKELEQIISESLRAIKFNDSRGYFNLYEMNGNVVMHGTNSEFETLNIYTGKQTQTALKMQEIIESLKTVDSVFLNLDWYKPNNYKVRYKKITYNRIFRPLNIFIQTGEYIDDFEKETQAYILRHLQNINYGKNDYIFVFGYDGVQLAHIKKEYIGVNRINIEDKNGIKIAQAVINKAKEGGGFVSYVATIMPTTGKAAEKITYVKGLQKWGWAVASGFYTKEMLDYLETKSKELEKVNNKSFEKIFALSIILSILLIILSVYISSILQKFFTNYHERIEKEIAANRKKDIMLYQQSKMASMGEMIGNIAHQWRQPLNLISTAASSIKLEEELGLLTKKSQEDSLDSIMNSTQYLSRTIDDFREFFNPNKSKEIISTTDLFEKTIKLVNVRFKNHNIDILNHVEEFEINAYTNELIQAMINIVNNAIDILKQVEDEDKLIYITIQKLNKQDLSEEIEVSNLQRYEEYAYIEIKDSAGGIADTVIDKIFEAYFTTKHQAQGTGIGLYMTYQIVVKHLLGQINVQNETFEYNDKTYTGAKFTIILPLE